MSRYTFILFCFLCGFLNLKANIVSDFGVASDPNSKHRDSMQDTHCIISNREPKYFAIFDGHGTNGKKYSEYLANNLHLNIMPHEDLSYDLKGVFNQVFFDVNKDLRSENYGNGGSCALIALIQNNGWLSIASLGDSRAVLACEGKPKCLSGKAHIASDEEEKDRVRDSGGMVYPSFYDRKTSTFGPDRVNGRLVLSRSFGNFDIKGKEGQELILCKPYIDSYKIDDSYDFLILACDGVWDVFTNEEAVNFVQGLKNDGCDAHESAKKLVQEAIAKESKDNITAIVIYFNHDKFTASNDYNSDYDSDYF